MTQQTNTYSQPAKLVWKKSPYDENKWVAETSFGTIYTIAVDKNIWMAQKGEFELFIEYPNKMLAIKDCQADYDRKWNEGSEPAPFWKPIEECPRAENVFYFCFSKHKGRAIVAQWGTWDIWDKENGVEGWLSSENSLFDDDDITHFAYIPKLNKLG